MGIPLNGEKLLLKEEWTNTTDNLEQSKLILERIKRC